MSKRLFVGNLPFQLTYPELEDLFTEFSSVTSLDLVTDQATGRSRGFAFVELSNDDEAQATIAKLNGYELDGQTLTVYDARPQRSSTSSWGERDRPAPRVERPAFAGRSAHSPSSGTAQGTKLYVGNLPYSATVKDIQALFSQTGTVISVSLITDRTSGQSKGFGFVEMSSPQEAQAAISRFDNYLFAGRPLKVNEARPQERSSGGLRGPGGGGGHRR